ncbi:MAG: PP2C family protein-serine/threonine phosphatase [Gemmataceae bacterium]|nr:PP2C family protein-serine/threonine phosphatase [Gemmataceae bacterium]
MGQMRRQLETIAELQRHLLPRRLPDLPGWQMVAHYAVGPCAGGDYYDFLPLADGRLLFLVGDASDEGAPSTVLIALVRVMLHACPLSSGIERLPFCPLRGEILQPPHVILANLNRLLVENSLEEQYMTAFCGLLSPAEGTLHYATAAHPPPLWWRARLGAAEVLREASGLPLGLCPDVSYHHHRIDIEPGDFLVCYTDGVTAAQNAHGTAFGLERLAQTVGDFARAEAAEIKGGILAALDDFLQGRPSQDDVTLVVLKRQV